MAIWGVTALLLSVSFLIYRRYTVTSFDMLPQWLKPAKRRMIEREQPTELDPSPATETNNADKTGHHTNGDGEDFLDQEETPKVTAAEVGVTIPTFSLDESHISNEWQTRDAQASNAEGMFDSASQSASRPKDSAVPPSSAGSREADPGTVLRPAPPLMAPPPRPSIAVRPLEQRSAASLRVPTTGPLPNRGLPANSQQRISSPTANGIAVPTPNSRNKVLLSPGHSPMDWAALMRNPASKTSGVDTFQRVTPSRLKAMTGRKGKPAWSSWQGKVYNITPYLPFHPGGEAELMKAAGRDGTKLFLDVHPWVNWENMLSACLVGVMVPEEYERSDLEEMD